MILPLDATIHFPQIPGPANHLKALELFREHRTIPALKAAVSKLKGWSVVVPHENYTKRFTPR